MDLKERLTQKLGPLPVWGWGAIVGIVVLVGYFLYSRASGSSGAGSASAGSSLDPQGYQTAGIQGGSASNTADVPAIPSNQSWLAKAAKLVADTLSQSPSQVYNALKKYLQGSPLTSQEQSWVDEALSRTGVPPEGTQGISDSIPDEDDAIQNPDPAPTRASRPAQLINSVAGYVREVANGQPTGNYFAMFKDGSIAPVTPGVTLYGSTFHAGQFNGDWEADRLAQLYLRT